MQGCALFLCGASRFGEKTHLKRGVFLSMALAGAGAETEWRGFAASLRLGDRRA
jgi:hypothetical protein